MTEAKLYKVKLSGKYNEFEYNGVKYKSGSTFETDDPCDVIAFDAASAQNNPKTARNDVTPNFWNNVVKRCAPIVVTAEPSDEVTSATAVESNPNSFGGDSAKMQGAPGPPSGSTLSGHESDQKKEPTAGPNEEPTRPQNGEPHPSHGDPKSQVRTKAADPIDLFRGAFYLEETDLQVPNTILTLAFVRSYCSGAATYGPLGWNWDHNFNLYVRELNNGEIALWRNLHEDIFKFDGINFEPPRGVFEKLYKVPSIEQVFEIAGGGGTVMHFERPSGWIDGERIPLLWIRDRHGNKLVFSYNSHDKLIEVRDDDDRFFNFEYDQCGLLISVSDHAGRKYQYGHDEQTMQLIYVQTPATTIDHPNGITKFYHYEQPYAPPELRHNIVRVEDSNGNIYIENKYDQDPASWSYARIVEQLYGGYLFQFRYTQLQWVPNNTVYINIPSVSVEVLNPDFSLETYTFNYRGDLLDRRYRLNKDKSFRLVVWQYELDEQGNLSMSTRPDGSQEINIYDFDNPDPRMRGMLLQKEITAAIGFPSPSRIIWKAKYEPIYQLLREEENETGAVTKYRYDFDVNPAAINNSGKLIELVHPEATLPDGTVQSNITKYENNNKGQNEATVSQIGVRQEMEYGTSGFEKSRFIKQILDVGGLNIVSEIKYDAFGYDTERIDANGNSTIQIFNALGLVEKTILPAINAIETEVRYHYDFDKKLVSIERPRGTYSDKLLAGEHIVDKFEREVLGYVIKYHLSNNTSEERTTRICPDFRGFPIETFNPDGSRIRRTYDERGLIIKEEVIGNDNNSKLSSKIVYDRSGKIMQETDTFGLTTKYEYDGFSRLYKVILPNETQIIHNWLSGDLLASEEVIGEDGFGNNRQLAKKTYSYDEKGRRVTETVKTFRNDPSTFVDVTTTYYYDALDKIQKISDNRGGIKLFQYDSLGRLVIETDPMNNEAHFSYDNNGNLIQLENHHQEPDGTVSILTKIFAYDARNRRTETIELDGAKLIDEYDDRDLIIRKTDYLKVAREISYNSFQDRIGEIHDAGGLNISNQWTVDSMSRVTSYVDPTGQISHYHWDSLGRNYKIDYPNGFSVTRKFNNLGQIVEETFGSGVKFEYGFDAANRLNSINNIAVPAFITPLLTHAFVYDGLDRVVSAKIGADTVVRKYDSTGRLLSEKTHGSELLCNYDDDEGVVEKIWPDGRTEKYSHDLNGVLTSIQETASGSLGAGGGLSLIVSLKPSGSNYFGQASYQGGLNVAYMYDERKRMVELSISSPEGIDEKIKYRYDVGNRMRVEGILGQDAKITYFEFDNKHRISNARDGFDAVISDGALTQADHDQAISAIMNASLGAAHEEVFAYDPSDARAKYTQTGSIGKNYTYIKGHRMQSDGTNSYSYFTEGTLQNDGQSTYRTDALGRIVTVKSGSTDVCNIDYDALGRPSTVKETGKPVKSFNYLGGFVEQENENGIASRQFSIHPVTGIPIAYHSALGTHYPLFDSSRYNMVGLANTNGELLETFRYSSFGVPEIKNSAGNTIPTSAFGIEPIFGGQKFLTSTSLYMSKRRFMDPSNGVFLSPDPSGYVDSPSLYAYAAQDPINNVDPNGDIAPVIAIAIIAGALLGGGYSIWDASNNPQKYEGAAGIWRPLVQTAGGAVIAAGSVVAGEFVMALGGGAAAAGGGAGSAAAASGAGATMGFGKAFLLYGTSSVASGAVARAGANYFAPELVDPVSADTVATDFVTGGAIGSAFKGLANYAAKAGFGHFAKIPGSGKFADWLRFGKFRGGVTYIARPLGKYPGRIGAFLSKIGIYQGDASIIYNWDQFVNHPNPFAVRDTAVHEGFHAFVNRYLPTISDWSYARNVKLGAIARYPEEVIAYALGRGSVGRVHAVPFAPFEAFRSLSDYGPSAVEAAKTFYSTVAGASAGPARVAIEYLFSGNEEHPNETTKSK